jgi:hypothetical protein
MTDISLPATRFSVREFRVGEALNKAMQTLSRNVLPFSIVTGLAALPSVLIFQRNADEVDSATMAILFSVGILAFGRAERAQPGGRAERRVR